MKKYLVTCFDEGDCFALYQFIKNQKLTGIEVKPMSDVLEEFQSELYQGSVILDDVQGLEVSVVSTNYAEIVARGVIG